MTRSQSSRHFSSLSIILKAKTVTPSTGLKPMLIGRLIRMAEALCLTPSNWTSFSQQVSCHLPSPYLIRKFHLFVSLGLMYSGLSHEYHQRSSAQSSEHLNYCSMLVLTLLILSKTFHSFPETHHAQNPPKKRYTGWILVYQATKHATMSPKTCPNG